MPGCLTATPLTEMIDVEEGFGSSATSAPTAGSAVMPLAYYYGFPSPKDNTKLYNVLLARLAKSVKRRLDEDEAGMFTYHGRKTTLHVIHVALVLCYSINLTIYCLCSFILENI